VFELGVCRDLAVVDDHPDVSAEPATEELMVKSLPHSPILRSVLVVETDAVPLTSEPCRVPLR